MFSGILYGLFGVVLAITWGRDMTFSFKYQDAEDISLTNDLAFADQALSHHNWFRAQHNADALAWNASMATATQQWASGCVFKHSQAGQNLVAGFPTVAHSIDAWGLERQQYDWTQPGFKENTGHFTQLVWKDSSELGCGRKLCPAGTIFPDFEVWYVVCNYANAGNVVGGPSGNDFFVENVGEQVLGLSNMGIVSSFLSAPMKETRRGSVEGPIKTVENLQARATSLANHVREDVSDLFAAIAAKIF